MGTPGWCSRPPSFVRHDEPRPFYGRLLDLEFDHIEPVGVASTLQESVDLVLRPPQDLLHYSTFGYEAPAGDTLSQHDTFPEGLEPSDSSAGLIEQLPLTVVRGIREKVKCNWSGCSRVVNKNNLTHHINELHRRKIRAVCNRCGKGYTRPYLMMGHNCRVKHRGV